MTSLPDGVFRAIVQRTGAPFVIISLDPRIMFASDTVSSLLGWSAREIVGRNISEFVRSDDIELAVAAIAEIDTVDRAGAGVPVTLPVATRGGGDRYVEVAALPLYDLDLERLIALRLRIADAQHHLGEFVRRLVAGDGLSEVFVELARSVAAENEAVAASIHWGFDGTSFVDCAGSWRVDDGALSESQALACAMEGPELTQIDAPPAVADATGAVTGWLVPVRPQRSIEPALIAIWRDRGEAPFLGHRRALVRAADYVSLALSRASEQDRLLYLAGHDSLTGTANRAAFVESLDQMLGQGEINIAVGYADLDGFKQVNDRFGHAAGDEILVAVAERIRSQLRSGDLLARIGGDEFTLLLRNVPETGVAEGVARRVVDAISTDFAVDANCVRLGVSVGIAMGRAGVDATTLLREADAALYEAKRARSSIAVAPVADAFRSP